MMNKLKYLFISLPFLFFECRNVQPAEPAIIGTWSSDNAVFVFEENGLFSAENLPSGIFFIEPKARQGQFSGKGKWKFRMVQDDWEIYLHFDEISNDYKGYETSLLLSKGRDGQWNIFLWKEEEGGERYEFHKNR
jgi:hypothetical protein